MEKIKLIALDIDGTLLDDAKQLPAENREVLHEAGRRGIIVAIASGRMLPRIEPIEDALGLDCVIVAYNGGKVVGPRREGRPVVAHVPVPPDVAEIFILYAHEKGLLLNFYMDDKLFGQDGPSRRPFMHLYTGRTGSEYVLVEDLRRFLGLSPTKMILLAEPEECTRLEREFQAKLGPRAFITTSEAEYLEVMAPGVDKGSAVQAIARYYGIRPGEVMALGDAPNDIGMISSAGYGVAMANSSPRVKAAAQRITERTNNEAGVAEAIRRWALAG